MTLPFGLLLRWKGFVFRRGSEVCQGLVLQELDDKKPRAAYRALKKDPITLAIQNCFDQVIVSHVVITTRGAKV